MQPVTHARSEYGGSMAWTAVFMAAVLVPLLMITVAWHFHQAFNMESGGCLG